MKLTLIAIIAVLVIVIIIKGKDEQRVIEASKRGNDNYTATLKAYENLKNQIEKEGYKVVNDANGEHIERTSGIYPWGKSEDGK